MTFSVAKEMRDISDKYVHETQRFKGRAGGLSQAGIAMLKQGLGVCEVVRRVADVEAALTQDLQDDNHFYEEYVVVDAAGRLQIPAELCERTGIGSRVILEEEEGHILIRPVAGIQPTVSPNGQTAATIDEQQDLDGKPTKPRRKGWRWPSSLPGWLGRKKT